jgi:hypothetical protein
VRRHGTDECPGKPTNKQTSFGVPPRFATANKHNPPDRSSRERSLCTAPGHMNVVGSCGYESARPSLARYEIDADLASSRQGNDRGPIRRPDD